MGKNSIKLLKYKEPFSVRSMLLSTGELIYEAVIIGSNDKVFYESAPFGATVGLKETQSQKADYISGLNVLNDPSLNIARLTQEEFDFLVRKNFSSQIATAFSLAYLKLLTDKENYRPEKIYEYLSSTYKIERSDPEIICNLLNGSKHAYNKLAFCEFMIIPNSDNIEQNIKIVSEVYLDLAHLIEEELGSKNLFLGREGGYAPDVKGIKDAINLLIKAIKLRNDGNCRIAIDIAANSFCAKNNDTFIYTVDNMDYTTTQLFHYYIDLIRQFPIINYLEDPFHELDTLGWKKLFNSIGASVLIVGDDLTVSKIEHVKKHEGYINTCILKINQSGNLSELIETLKYCKKKNIKTIISQRSGETDSNLLAHLAVGLGADYMKAGAPARERIVKYNELRRISGLN